MIQLVPITALYASLCAILIVGLAFNVVGQRRENKVGIGDRDVESLALAIRSHGNAVEYIPIALIADSGAGAQRSSGGAAARIGWRTVSGQGVAWLGFEPFRWRQLWPVLRHLDYLAGHPVCCGH